MAPREFLEKRERHLRALFPNATEIKGAGEYLQRLKEIGTRIALATSSSKALCEIKIGHRAWSDIFECRIHGDDPELLRSKPAPDIFILCARRMGVSPENIIVFEDSKNGIRAAKGAGVLPAHLQLLPNGRRGGGVPACGVHEDRGQSVRVAQHHGLGLHGPADVGYASSP